MVYSSELTSVRSLLAMLHRSLTPFFLLFIFRSVPFNLNFRVMFNVFSMALCVVGSEDLDTLQSYLGDLGFGEFLCFVASDDIL